MLNLKLKSKNSLMGVIFKEYLFLLWRCPLRSFVVASHGTLLHIYACTMASVLEKSFLNISTFLEHLRKLYRIPFNSKISRDNSTVQNLRALQLLSLKI